MEGKILVIDRDPDLIHALHKGVEKFRPEFGVLTASETKIAAKLLKTEPVCLVLCNLKVPKANDIAFIKELVEVFPDVGVIAITGLKADELQKMINASGDIRYIEYPYAVGTVVDVVIKALEQQAEGGVLYHVSTGMFLQLIEMEQRTCTIRLMSNDTKKRGALFFKNGILFDARSNGMRGEDAAYEIFSWDRVSLWIENNCFAKERKITKELQALILEAMRRKDESAAKDALPDKEGLTGAELIVPDREVEKSEAVARVKKRLKGDGSYCSDIIEIREDTTWDGLLAQGTRIGAFFESGELKVAYFDRGDGNDYLVVPEDETVVIEVDPKCPRDRFIKLFLSKR